MNRSELGAMLLEELKIEFDVAESKEVAILDIKVRSAIREIERAIGFPKTFSDEDITAELLLYASNIKNLAMYDFAKLGAEGEDSHSENGTDRKYTSREKCFNGVVRYADL